MQGIERQNQLAVLIGMLMFGSQKYQNEIPDTNVCGLRDPAGIGKGSWDFRCLRRSRRESPHKRQGLFLRHIFQTSRELQTKKRSKVLGKDMPRSYPVSALSTGVQFGALPLFRPLVFCCLRRDMDMM
jgi:hypothetical protein